MKIFLDHSLIHKITSDASQERSLLGVCFDADILKKDQSLEVVFDWPSLLEYLNLGNLFENFPLFNEHNELFTWIISTAAKKEQKDLLIRLYDQVFVECLTHVKALPQIHPAFLIDQMRKKSLVLHPSDLWAQSLHRYEKALVENPAHTMHDLILYLAWDRVCVYLARVFEHPSPEIDIREGLEVLKECLVESFQHITAQGRTKPGFFRLMEALYAYQMREENLQVHTDTEWTILCQSACALKPRASLSDVVYIDAAIVDDQQMKQEQNIVRVMTLEPKDKVRAALVLAQYMIEKLKSAIPDWHYALHPVEVVCMQEHEDKFVIDDVVQCGLS